MKKEKRLSGTVKNVFTAGDSRRKRLADDPVLPSRIPQSDKWRPDPFPGKVSLVRALVIAALAVWFWLHRDDCSDRALLLAAAVLAAAIPFFLPHMHDRYFFAADALTLALAAAWPQLALPALLCEFASLLGYHAYLRMRYLLPMSDGALALIAALAVLTAVLVTEMRQTAPAERKTKKST